ncbi:MAG: MFS transporter [Lachnospiraceae bacterium]|nr:MFS transporter [Lachnospiraceae bacterium]
MVHLLLVVIYISFISLGLPDGLLGAGWPTMYQEFRVPVSYAGGVYMIICAGTVISSLMSDRISRRFEAGMVTAVSVAMTAAAMFGFSISRSYWQLCLWAIPYGLGAGSVDASLNNYVAIHYESRHMSWLHCMWGVGASVGPYIMEFALTGGNTWNSGYRYVFLIQSVLVMILFAALPMWKKRMDQGGSTDVKCGERPLTLKEVFAIPGAREIMITFFAYSAVEQTAALWSGSYLALGRGLSDEAAAGFAALFFVGITVGRAISGFLTIKINDTNMIRLGCVIITGGILILFLPGIEAAKIGLVMVGLGCAPVYPCIIHATPEHFGDERSQAIVGIQMASAYCGNVTMPPLFGLIANHISIRLLPLFLLAALICLGLMHEHMLKQVKVQ